jgi:hypothetical protein
MEDSMVVSKAGGWASVLACSMAIAMVEAMVVLMAEDLDGL